MRKVWILTIACLILLLFNSIYAEETKPRKNYQIIRDMECSEIYIKAVTHCLVESKYEECFIDNQEIFFKNKKKDIEKIIKSSSPTHNFREVYDEDEQILKEFAERKVLDFHIGILECYKDKYGNPYIGLYYGNGGNCNTCEYFEIYDKFGNLVITDRDKIIYKNGKASFDLKIYTQAQRKLQNLGLKIIKVINLSNE